MQSLPHLLLVFKASINWFGLEAGKHFPIFKNQLYTSIHNNLFDLSYLKHILYSHIYLHLSEYNILCDEQHDFHKARSCETRLLLISDFVVKLNNKR